MQAGSMEPMTRFPDESGAMAWLVVGKAFTGSDHKELHKSVWQQFVLDST
jgi:hypothetical protein